MNAPDQNGQTCGRLGMRTKWSSQPEKSYVHMLRP